MQIQLGTIDVDPLKLDKRTDFSVLQTLNIQVFENCNVKTPVFILSPFTDWELGCNYMKIVDWDAYYFLSEPDIIDGKRCRFFGEMDYLTTYADGIKELHGYLARTGDDTRRNKLIRDSSRPIQANRHERTIAFNKSPFSVNYGTDTYMILTVVGGKHS